MPGARMTQLAFAYHYGAVAALAVAIASCDADRAPAGPHSHPFVSELLTRCKKSPEAWRRAAPWMLVYCTAVLLMQMLRTGACLQERVALMGGAWRAWLLVPAGALALAALCGMAIVTRYDFEPDGSTSVNSSNFRHAAGFGVLMYGVLVAHLCTVVLARHCTDRRMYTASVALLIATTGVFTGLWAVHAAIAVPVQYAQMGLFVGAGAANLHLVWIHASEHPGPVVPGDIATATIPTLSRRS